MIYDLYSRRRRRDLQQEPDVYQYDEIPETLRNQILYIWNEAIGKANDEAWQTIRGITAREKGLLTLARADEPRNDCVTYLLKQEKSDEWLDLIEISFRFIDRVAREYYSPERHGITRAPDAAISELNDRFRLATFGYRFENGQILRIDSEFLHAEIVKPSLVLLSDERFSAPQEEYLTAHGHYRSGHFSDAVTNANNAFESTMKVICDIKVWEYNKGDRASELIKIMRKKGLLPEYTEKAFDAFLSTLQHGLPTVRNNAGGHGKGNAPATPQHLAAYAMHLAAANIVLLVEAFQASEKTL